MFNNQRTEIITKKGNIDDYRGTSRKELEDVLSKTSNFLPGSIKHKTSMDEFERVHK